MRVGGEAFLREEWGVRKFTAERCKGKRKCDRLGSAKGGVIASPFPKYYVDGNRIRRWEQGVEPTTIKKSVHLGDWDLRENIRARRG